MKAPPANTAVRRNPGNFALKHSRLSLILVSGLPGTGKSYFSRKLAERLTCTILESDAVRKELFSLPAYSPAESTSVFKTIYRRMEELLGAGNSVILDATNLTEKHRREAYNSAVKTGARLIIVQVEAPPQLVKERLKDRAARPGIHDRSDADWNVYQRMKPTAEKIQKHYISVDTSRDINPALEKILQEINR
jgi:predicted kinase